MLKQTILHAEHQRLGAKLVDFAGWDMPIQYASQLDEHSAVRQAAGMFDVAHMAAVDLIGARVPDLLRVLLTNDIGKLQSAGQSLYSCMLNAQGGVIDDLIVTRMRDDHYRLVINAGTTDKDLAWLRTHAERPAFNVTVRHRDDLGILAVQGPEARAKVEAVLARKSSDLAARTSALAPFHAAWSSHTFVSRTGYSGEDGYELILPHAELRTIWADLLAAGVTPCGLGARDTLRLEAGLNLYGQDMDETVSPLECGLGWTVAFIPDDRAFIGREALEAQRAKPPRKALGLVLEGRGVLRAHRPVRSANGLIGETTSGGYAPTLSGSIAMARMPADAEAPFEVDVRGTWLPVRVVKPPFVRHGRVLV